MKTTEKKNVEIESVNDKLYDDLFVHELEERLETDPLAANGLFSLFHEDGTGFASDTVIEPLCTENVCNFLNFG